MSSPEELATRPFTAGTGRRILIDARMATVGGGYTHLVNVVPRLVALRPGDRFRVFLRSERAQAALPEAPNLEVNFVGDTGTAGRLRFTLIDAPRIARRWGADLLFSISEYAPLTTPCPTIVSFRNPNVFTPLRQGWAWNDQLLLGTKRVLAQLVARRCARVLFVSEDSARWIGDRVGLPESRRAVVHHGVEPAAFSPSRVERPHPRPYVLSVGTNYRYKNFVRLIEAWALLARTRPDVPDLVIIGDDQDPQYAVQMKQARTSTGELAERVHLLGEVRYEDVKAYYAHAELFVFPSYLETFGHPLLEAMASDTPLVASDIEVFREVAGEAAVYADPFEPGSLAAAIGSVLDDPDLAGRLVSAGRERVTRFTWERSAAGLLRLFDEVLEERAADPCAA